MYSYEDRIRAVKLYIKLGKRLRATIRQLGYPTKNSLIGWYREYERSQRPASRLLAIRTEVLRSAEVCGGEALP
jgi:transposase-like protein